MTTTPSQSYHYPTLKKTYSHSGKKKASLSNHQTNRAMPSFIFSMMALHLQLAFLIMDTFLHQHSKTLSPATTPCGYSVTRRFGWDCHGLPIEHEINKSMDMPADKAYEMLGKAGYNQACRDIVMRYRDAWRSTIERLGRWVDFDNDYKTMDKDFMESVWWVFEQLWQQKLIYQGTKVMPYSTALQTPIANFEAGSNYQQVQDPAIQVILSCPDSKGDLVIWTTTPWTLPAKLSSVCCSRSRLRLN